MTRQAGYNPRRPKSGQLGTDPELVRIWHKPASLAGPVEIQPDEAGIKPARRLNVSKTPASAHEMVRILRESGMVLTYEPVPFPDGDMVKRVP